MLGGLALACVAPAQRSPDAELVPCPLEQRANVVLATVVRECASSRGHWAHDLGPGCPRVWATQLGFTAGRRRGRADLVRMARVTAARQSADLTALALDALLGGEAPQDGPQALGAPALLVSGVLDGRGFHYWKLRLALARSLERLDLDALGDTQTTGLAGLCAQMARIEQGEREAWLERARTVAARIAEPKLAAFARASIARASGREEDLARAREVVAAALPATRSEDGGTVLVLEERYALSHYLALAHAVADLALLSRSPGDRALAESLVELCFSDAFFDGRVLVHDGARDGWRSSDYCSGCNLQALYLVDRVWGDTFRIDPLPELPRRPEPWLTLEERRLELFALLEGQSGTWGGEDFGLSIGYREVAPDEAHPLGAVRLEFTLSDAVQRCRLERAAAAGALVPLDEAGRARFTPGRESLREGTYDPEVSRTTIELGPPRDGRRTISLVRRVRRPV